VIVVSNTSPVSVLASVGRLGLIHDLYPQVIIPTAVAGELVNDGLSRPPAEWIDVREVRDRGRVAGLRAELDDGEAEAIALAIELRADLLLIDERAGRKAAARHGLVYTGVLGMLLAAERAGLIDTIAPLLDELVTKADFWVGPALRARILREAGE
jgi:predicted nucleic acid-binding protein